MPVIPPPWATDFGQDRFGIYGKVMVEGVPFGFRWIPPGAFVMGAPEEEKGRRESEPLKEVEVTEGFWMLETPVTQQMWLTIERKDPSHFEKVECPVERVSWEDCQSFIGQLNQRIPRLNAALPTEALWEYACRAGTRSAFNDGSPCTKPQGIDPALEKLGWYDRNSDARTQAVREKDPNAWGLYDMHGNVWEWCQDETTEFGNSARRVVRGGSWNFSAGYCRSAARLAFVPEYRYGYLGFRLVAGQEFKPSPEDQTAGGRY
ncbi:MAG: formylglycine-generating enzyme family protein [Verrucomicrobiota bacterium]